MGKVVKFPARGKLCPACQGLFHRDMLKYRAAQYPRRLVCVDCFASLTRQATEERIAYAYDVNARRAELLGVPEHATVLAISANPGQ